MNLQFQLDFVDWLLIAAALIGLYSILLLPLKDSEKWRSRGISVGSVLGIPLAMFFRTSRGLNLLDRLARPKRFLENRGLGRHPSGCIEHDLFFDAGSYHDLLHDSGATPAQQL